MSNKMYDVLSDLQRWIIPALGTLYFSLAQIWNLPYAEEVVGTLTAIVTFMGACLKISSVNYQNAKETADAEDGDEDGVEVE